MKDLSPAHYKMLREGSGISDEIIELRPYKTVTDSKALEQLGFSRVQARNVPGLLLPVNCTDGTNGLCVYRPDIPRVFIDKHAKRNADGSFKERVIKYELPPKVGVRLDCPRICRQLLADPDRPLWITEGQKKADALASRGLIALALLGVWNFKGSNSFGGVVFLADFDYIALKNRDVRIVFDSDVMTKPGVRKALERLTEHLQRKGAHVAVVHLPMNEGQKVGVDDFLLTHSIDDLELLIEGPRAKPRVAAPTIELIEEEPASIRRPLCLINGKGYAAIWPLCAVSKTEEAGRNDEIIKYDKPQVVTERRMLIIREDGRIFSTDEELNDTGFPPLKDLEVKLDTMPEAKHTWSTIAVKRYREGHRASPAAVFARIVQIVDYHIDFDRSLTDQLTMSEMIACYILATWLLDAFQVIGYLFPSGEFGSGKSELLNCVTQMAFLGEMVMAQSTIATIRDAADYGATLAFDEVERLQQDKTKADLMAILLAGNRRGTSLACKEPGSKDGKWVTRRFNCFTPRLFAAQRLPEGALATRSIIVPLIRSIDEQKPNRMVTAVENWPHDAADPLPCGDEICKNTHRKKLIDDLWALSLAHLSELKRYDDQVANRARLKGRQLEPWRAILAVAGWLDDRGVESLWDRMHALSLSYQAESQELDATSLTKLVIRALEALLDGEIEDSLFRQATGGVSPVGGVLEETPRAIFKTKDIAGACKQIATDDELPIKEEGLENRIGWTMKRLRFTKGYTGHKKLRGWEVSRSEIERYKQAFGVSHVEILEKNAADFSQAVDSNADDEARRFGGVFQNPEKRRETPPNAAAGGVSLEGRGVFFEGENAAESQHIVESTDSQFETDTGRGVSPVSEKRRQNAADEQLGMDSIAYGQSAAFFSENPHETYPPDEQELNFYDGEVNTDEF